MRSNDQILIPKANLRDIGGIQICDGSKVQIGHIYRSGHLSDLTESDLELLRSLQLKTIIDLRRPKENQERPHLFFRTVQLRKFLFHLQITNLQLLLDLSIILILLNRLLE